MKALAALTILGSLTGCCSPAHYAIGLPDRPHLEPIEAELQKEIPPHTLAIIGRNDLALKAYAKQLEARIRIHDEALKD